MSSAITTGGSGWYVSVATQQPACPCNCSSGGSSQSTLKAGLNQVLAEGDVDALNMNISVNGKVYAVFIEALPVSLQKQNGECGAPSPNP